jgi:hypothetical protein
VVREMLTKHRHPLFELSDAHWVHRMRLKEERGWRLLFHRVASSRCPAGGTPIDALCVRELLLSEQLGTAIVLIDRPMIRVILRTPNFTRRGGVKVSLQFRRRPVRG